ncbi:MAG: sugar phosphate isomerase/epimerase family protein [Prolixibacteraceae bacterium]
MDILFFCPKWGLEDLSYHDFLVKAKYTGFDGVEMLIPTEKGLKQEIRRLLDQFGLKLIAQQGEAVTAPLFEEHIILFEKHLRNACELNPLFINSQTGKDYFSFDENCILIEKAMEIELQTGVPIIHEIHRGKFTFAPVLMGAYMDKFPQIRFGFDISHWLTVSESTLQDPTQSAIVDRVIKHSGHIHARIGHEEGPQITDPRAPEWQYVVDLHKDWWNKIVQHARKNKAEFFTITPEFGPEPYMQRLPFTQMPVANQREINVHMKDTLKAFFEN